MGIAVLDELAADGIRPDSINQYFGFGNRQHFGQIVHRWIGQQIVEFGDQHLDLGNKLDEPFGHEDNAVILAEPSTGGDGIGYFADDFVERLFPVGNFLGDQGQVGLRLQRAFKGDVRCGAPHELDEVPVFAGRRSVAGNITDDIAILLAGRIEAEGGFDDGVLQVAVDGFGTADDLDTRIVLNEILGKDAGVGIRVIATDNDDTGDAASLAVGHDFVVLGNLFELAAAGTDHVEAAGVAMGIDDVSSKFDTIVVDKSVGTAAETEESRLGVLRFQPVKQAGDHVVAARCLAA